MGSGSNISQEAELRYLRKIIAQSLPPEGWTDAPGGEGVLIISPAEIREQMAGPGIRYWEFAKALSKVTKVTLAIPNESGLSHPDFEVRSYHATSPDYRALGGFEGIDCAELVQLAAEHQTIVIQGFVLYKCPELIGAMSRLGKYLAVDLYGPVALETLERHLGDTSSEAVKEYLKAVMVLNEEIRLGDFFFCACEKQRDYWLGRLEALGRVNPHTYMQDRSARRLIDVVPFGLPSAPPVHRRQVLKGVHPQVKPSDKVLVWLGGIWNWLDPLTLIRAMKRVVEQHDDVKLFFLSGSPRVGSSLMEMHQRAVELSRELGLYGKNVFFHPWVSYEERENYLLEADAGVCFHFDHLETRFSYRTRLLDYIWAGLPIVTGAGDTMGELVEREGLGFAVAPGDEVGLTNAILRLVNEPDARSARREAFARVASRLTWDVVTTPLQEYCRNPWRAADKLVNAYDRWTSNRWEQIVLDALRLEQVVELQGGLIQAFRNGRVMRLLLGSQELLRKFIKK